MYVERLKTAACTFWTSLGRKSTGSTWGAQGIGKILFNRLNCNLYLQRLLTEQGAGTEASLPGTTSVHAVLSETERIDTAPQELFLFHADFPSISRNYWEWRKSAVIWHIWKCIDNYWTNLMLWISRSLGTAKFSGSVSFSKILEAIDDWKEKNLEKTPQGNVRMWKRLKKF